MPRAGELDNLGSWAPLRTGVALLGDEIATRRNDRQLRTDRGEMVRNRAALTVEHIKRDLTVVASGRHGTIRLPAKYVAENVELAYATTGMGAQGRTVDHAILYLDSAADVRNVYVPMTP